MSFNIYYLDDEPLLCDLFVDYFESDDISITTFTLPELALKAAADKAPDLFFIDYRLPGTTGDIVALELPADIPKVLITGEINPKPEYQFDKIFLKPYNSTLIQDYLDLALKNQKK